MELKKLSATAMETAEQCLSRFAANQLAGYGGEQKGYPAKVGSTCHNALQWYVEQTIMEAKYEQSWETLEFFFQKAFKAEWGHFDTDSAEYLDCLSLLRSWHERSNFDGRRVLSCEQKLNFTVPTSVGVIPFNFIIDRLDVRENERGVYEVWDYKSLARPLTPDQLRDKLQARIYALAVQIKFKDSENPPERIYVKFDMLRHDTSVGTVFTREDQAKTWKRIKAACARIIEVPQEDALKMETLNEACGFCIKKTTCRALLGNQAAGGVHSYASLEEQVDARTLLKLQAAAVAAALKEFDPVIEAAMEAQHTTKVETPHSTAQLKVKNTRTVDAYMVERIVGEKTFRKYGSTGITLGNLDQLLKDPTIEDSKKREIEGLITSSPTSTYIETKLRNKR